MGIPPGTNLYPFTRRLISSFESFSFELFCMYWLLLTFFVFIFFISFKFFFLHIFRAFVLEIFDLGFLFNSVIVFNFVLFYNSIATGFLCVEGLFAFTDFVFRLFLLIVKGESGWRSCHHSRLPPLRPRIESCAPHVG